MTGLTDFQADVARLFFSVPASDGFLLAGGGALLASGLTSRPTEDLDFFGDRDHVDITPARDQFRVAVAERGWNSTRVQDSGSLVRLRISGEDEVIVDLAIDTPAGRPPVVSIVGPTFDPEELAGRKLIALLTALRPATSWTSTCSLDASDAKSCSSVLRRSILASTTAF